MKRQDDQAIAEFKKAVNMSPAELEKWLDTDESKKVGDKSDGADESVGHRSGEKIVRLLRKKKDDYTEADVEHMRKVVGYVNRHSVQRPHGDVTGTNWRYSLMNWGHDPTK